ncbi:response regulator transcription factor [Sulfurospirillum barnesii]|uniref:response regulator transcription factor n=1 Tax=Sulfurospirillum barnesii TaxID=44674 RepID=UPI0002F1291F|nr:response regulator transcription factor [Sulfurospirillum barnesii]
MKNRLLLLEDDTNLSETVCEFLESKGYEVLPVYDGEEAEEKMYEGAFDLLLLDVNVPVLNGFELLKKRRNEGDTTPAIFLTSLNAIEDLEHGYASGCDDYLRKPFALKELLFRIESLLRREFFHPQTTHIVIHETMTYDLQTHQLFSDNHPIQLQNKEAKLLKLFLQKKNEIISHETLMSHVWTYEEQGSDEALRTYIKNLRKLIGKEHIVSIKKLGYKFTL